MKVYETLIQFQSSNEKIQEFQIQLHTVDRHGFLDFEMLSTHLSAPSRSRYVRSPSSLNLLYMRVRVVYSTDKTMSSSSVVTFSSTRISFQVLLRRSSLTNPSVLLVNTKIFALSTRRYSEEGESLTYLSRYQLLTTCFKSRQYNMLLDNSSRTPSRA